MKFALILLLSAIAIGCGYGPSYKLMNGAPQIAVLSPSQVPAGSPAFNLTITGTGFTPGAIVYWGMTPLTSSTTYNSTTQVTAAISSPLIAHSGTVLVWLHTGGGNSNSMTFTII